MTAELSPLALTISTTISTTSGRARWWGLFAVVSVMLINFVVELVIADVVEDSGNWQAFTVAGVCAPARRLVATAAVCVGELVLFLRNDDPDSDDADDPDPDSAAGVHAGTIAGVAS